MPTGRTLFVAPARPHLGFPRLSLTKPVRMNFHALAPPSLRSNANLPAPSELQTKSLKTLSPLSSLEYFHTQSDGFMPCALTEAINASVLSGCLLGGIAISASVSSRSTVQASQSRIMAGYSFNISLNQSAS